MAEKGKKSEDGSNNVCIPFQKSCIRHCQKSVPVSPHVRIYLYVYVYLYCFCFSPPHSFADLANCYSFPGFHRQVRAPRKSVESPAIFLDCQVRASERACLDWFWWVVCFLGLLMFCFFYLICFQCVCTYRNPVWKKFRPTYEVCQYINLF